MHRGRRYGRGSPERVAQRPLRSAKRIPLVADVMGPGRIRADDVVSERYATVRRLGAAAELHCRGGAH
jgi:hypothetical protein